jgi:hypothetical protein
METILWQHVVDVENKFIISKILNYAVQVI